MFHPPSPPALHPDQIAVLQRYYRWQARLYDVTRWGFLFGRRALLDAIALRSAPQRILEVGCGTGSNLLQLTRRFPRSSLVGIDVSAHMLAQAKRKLARWPNVELQQRHYFEPLQASFDVVLFAYSLSMMNPGWEDAIAAAAQDLVKGGLIAVVDFASSPQPLFRHWMAWHHVHLEGHLLPVLNRYFMPLEIAQPRVYAGLWRYLRYIGTAS
ncbi:MAG: class I SAM-dependent methyltransferase [Gammaproteobacteria bacterium]|nr:class I SAM-dependent methyltransferase [Gammaproteobacteria bacterium]